MPNDRLVLQSVTGARKALAMLASAAVCVLAGCNADREAEVAAVAVPPTAATAPAASAQPASPQALPQPTLPDVVEKSPADVELAGRVEAALAAETQLHGSAIAVRTADGVVTLTGSTRDPQARSMAAQIALSVGGVKHVKNDLAVARDA